MRRSAFGLLFSLSVLALALIPLLGSGVTTVSANGGDVCISINGDTKVDTIAGGASCFSFQSDEGKPNIARAYDGGTAIVGSGATDSGNTATATGAGSFAYAYGGDNNTATATGADSYAFAYGGDNNTATATGAGSYAESAFGDNNTTVATGGGTASVYFGDNNTVTATGDCFVEAAYVSDQTLACP